MSLQMTDYMNEKMVLFGMGGAESEEYLVIVSYGDLDAAKDAIDYAKDEYYDALGDANHYDLLEDHVARALREKGIEFAMPQHREH